MVMVQTSTYQFYSQGGSPAEEEGQAEEEVQEVEAPARTAKELKIRFNRTPKGVGASGDIRGKYENEIVHLPRRMYPNNCRHDQKK